MRNNEIYWKKYFNKRAEHGNTLYKKADYSSNLSLETRYENVSRILDELNLNGARVLDAGCGVGMLINLIKRRYPFSQIIGLDLSINALKLAKEQGESNLIKGSITSIPIREGVFDVVFCIEVFQYVNNWHTGLNELDSVIKPEGFLIISTLNKRCLFLRPRILGILKKLKFTKMDENIVPHDKCLFKEYLKNKGYSIKKEIDLPIPVRWGKLLLRMGRLLSLKSAFSYAFIMLAQKH